MSDDEVKEKREPLLCTNCREEYFAWIAKRYAPAKTQGELDIAAKAAADWENRS